MSVKKSMKIAMAYSGINQRELAKASGLSEVTISTINNGKASPSMATITKLAKATGFSFVDFINLGE